MSVDLEGQSGSLPAFGGATFVPPSPSDVKDAETRAAISRAQVTLPVPRRDKSLSALSHELIARYGQEGTVIDLDDVQARAYPSA